MAMRTWLCGILLGAAFAARFKDDINIDDWSPVKLVINSNVNYQTPLKMLLDSMRAVRFTNFSDVVVVVGGADEDQIYRRNDIVYIETPFENYDLTGLSVLWHYKEHPFVRAHVYLYLLDTTTVGAGFPEKFQSLQNVGHKEYRSGNRPASNICAFGRGVLENFGYNFDVQLSKNEGLNFEFGHEIRGVKQIEDFATTVTELRPRQERANPVDIYQTGIARKAFWYPDFDVVKYILLGRDGDMSRAKIRSVKCCPKLQGLRHHESSVQNLDAENMIG